MASAWILCGSSSPCGGVRLEMINSIDARPGERRSSRTMVLSDAVNSIRGRKKD